MIWLLALLPFFLAAGLLTCAFWFVISIVASIAYTFALICEADDCLMMMLMIILFPITWVVGLGMAFQELFCQVLCNDVVELMRTPFEILADICDD